MNRVITAATLVVALQGAALPAAASPAAPNGVVHGGTYTPPDDFPSFDVTTVNDPAPGFLFLAKEAATDRYLMILDDTAFPVYFQESVGVVRDFKKQANGLLTYYDRSSVPGSYRAMDDTYTIVDEWLPQPGFDELDSHDFQMLPNGNVLVFYADERVVDMSQIVPGGDPAAIVIGLVIQEIDTNQDVVFQWESWDHFQITDATSIDLTAHTIDYVHCNALEADTDGNILVSSRHLSEITKIDRTTGDILWRMGGSQNEFTLVGDTQWFTYQHAIRRTATGTVTLFDNGNLSTPQESRALEYELDETNKIATRVWEYRHTPALYAPFTGNVQRLPNGNSLISWGGLGVVTEVHPDGSTAFEMSFTNSTNRTYRAFRFPWTAVAAAPTLWATVDPDSVTLNFAKFGDENVAQFHVYRGSAPEPLTIVGSTAVNSYVLNDVAPSETLYVRVTAEDGAMIESPFSNELQLVIPATVVATPSVEQPRVDLALHQNYPNPLSSGTSIRFVLPVTTSADLSVYDVSGRLVRNLHQGEIAAGMHQSYWDGTDSRGHYVSSGIYFYRLTAGDQRVTKRMTLVR
jgi:hypothetical protein